MFKDKYLDDGVLMSRAFGRDYPDCFTHPILEYRALTTNVALIDLTHWNALRITGSDRARFLNGMVTNDVMNLQDNCISHAAMTTVKGKLVADLYVLKRPEELMVLVAQGDTGAVTDALNKHIIADDVVVEDMSADYGVLSVEGPNSRELVWRLFPDGPLPLEPLTFGDTDYQGTQVTVIRNSVAGAKGMQLLVPSDGIERIREYLIQAGAGMDMLLAGRVAWNLRRVEMGLPWFGFDIGEDNFPQESRMDDLINYDKGCYLGQEPLARMHFRGHPNWTLEALTPTGPGDMFPLPGFMNSEELPQVQTDSGEVRRHITELLFGGVFDGQPEIFPPEATSSGDKETSAPRARVTGRITSPVYSPALRKPLFMGYVRTNRREDEQQLVVQLRDRSCELELLSLPIEGD